MISLDINLGTDIKTGPDQRTGKKDKGHGHLTNGPFSSCFVPQFLYNTVTGPIDKLCISDSRKNNKPLIA
jgi:hypothetical protein